MRSSGAYSSISRRSAPSCAKRTVTTPPGSTRRTTPSPSVPWRTLSPVDRSGRSVFGDERPGAVRRPRGGPQPLALDALRRQLVEEARGQVVRAVAVERPRGRVRHRQPFLRPGHAHVAEAPLLLERVLLDRPRMREDPLLHPDHEDALELEALRVVERHERDERLTVAQRVLVGVERDLLEEVREARLGRGGLVLLRDADELAQVLHPALRLDRPLGVERIEIARVLEHALNDLRDGELARGGLQRLEQRPEPLHVAERRAGDACLLGAVERLEERRRPSRPRVPRGGPASCRRSRGAAGSRSAGARPRRPGCRAPAGRRRRP